MPANDSSEFDYVPGYTKPTHEYGTAYGDEFHAEAVQELLLSVNAGYTQRGVTLLGGQGVLPTGAILARETTSGCYTLYKSGGSNGVGTAVGILRDARDTGGAGGTGPLVTPSGGTVALTGGATFAPSPAGKAATPCQANIVYRGVLNASLVSGTDTGTILTTTGGGVTAAGAVAALGARIVPFGGGSGAFPGGPMDGDPGAPYQGNLGVNAWIF